MKQIYFIPPEKKWWNQLIQLFFISISLFILLPNTSNAQWTRKADALRNRGECPSVSYKGKIYVFGGFGEHPSIEKDNEVYDPISNTWSLIASFPAGKEVTHQGLVNIDDKVWHIGGRLVDANGPTTNKVIIYDITNNTWADGPELMDPANGQPLPLGGGGAALVGRTIHVFGGFSTDLCVDQSTYHLTLDVDRWLADPQNTRWENNRAPLPLPRNHMSTAVLGGKIYVFGGQTSHDCGAQEQVYNHMYDPLTNTWTRITDLPSPRSHCEPSTFATDGNIYMVGGQGPSNASQNTVYLFNPRTNGGLGSWSNLTNYRLPNYYYGISAKIINNLFIISHGAIKSIRNTKASTYTSPVTRNTPYEFGFLAPCFTKTVAASQQAIVKNILYTIEGEKQYSLTSDAPWLTISKNASGTVLPTGVEVEATINTATLAPGNYTANITATGTGGGTTYKSSSFCVNLTVSSADGSYTLAVSTVGNGSVIKSPFQTTYEAGTTVTLTATPAQGYQFAGWSGDATGTTNPLSLTMNSNKSVTATFEPVAAAQYTLTFTPPTNGSISKSPDQASYEAGSVVNLTATPAAGYLFVGWTGDATGTTNPLPLTMDSNKTISATFTAIPQTQFTLTITPPTNGSISKNPDQESYTSGSSVTLTATPAQGYQFAGWTGDASGTTNPLSVTMNSNKTISANFTAIQSNQQQVVSFTLVNANNESDLFTITEGQQINLAQLPSTRLNVRANTSPASVGSVRFRLSGAMSKSGTDNLAPYALWGDDGNGNYYYGSWNPPATGAYTLTATPYTGASGSGTAGTTLTVNFTIVNQTTTPTQYSLSLTTSGNGSVAKNPDQASYTSGTTVTLTATPAQGYQFAGWSGDATGTANPLSLNMNSNKSVTATFEPMAAAQYTLTITSPTNGSISKSPDQASYEAGSVVNLTATPAAGYQFAGWTGDASGTANPLPLTMDSNKTISATFTSTTPEPQPLLLFTPTSATVNIPGEQQKELKVNLNNSDEDPVTVQLTATEGQGTNVPAWLLYNGKTLSAANNVTYNLGSSGNEVLFTINSSSLSPGTYTAKVVASATGYTSAELAITMEVSTYDESQRPYVTAVRPADGEISVSLSQSVSVDIAYPSGKSIDGNTVNTNTVKLYIVNGEQKTEVTGTAVNATAAGDAITLSAPLLVNTTYEFVITDQVKDGNGYMMQPFTSRFTTVTSTNDNPTDLSGVSFTEQVLIDNSFGTDGFTSLIIGPDNRLYATTSGGKIERWDINQDGTLSNYVSISPFGANRRLLIGFHFDPSATASNLIAWISHSAPEFADAPDWSGKISRINLNNPSNPQLADYVTNLPRSSKDHTTNGIDFGLDGALYFLQGSNTAMGAPDGAWANRNERLLTAAVLRLDISKAEQQSLPIDVKTEEGGNYNPYGSNAPLTIFASGVRNAYDLVWHTNGQLYVPTNGSAAGGSTPALPSGTIWSDGQIYTGPDIPSMTDVRDTQNDYLFRIASGGYYGHPNPLRNEYILNGGNPTAGEDPAEIVWTTNGTTYGYPVGTPVEPNYRGWAFDFGLNKSPNGVIEYKSNAFDGKLKGKILVCRFSGGDDIMVLEPGTSNFDIIRATEGSAIPGFRRPFSNPLDLIEDTRNGNIYISEYFDGNGDGKPRITLLKVNQTNTPPPPAAANLINSGGGEFTDSQNRTWSADASFSGGVIGTKSFDVIGTTDDALYLNYRYAASAAPFSYNFTGTENGTYSVRLHFIEPYFGAPGGRAGGVGKRVFHVDIEGQRVLSNYDIFAQEGAAKAVVKIFDNVSVADGSLTIAFTSVTDNAIISAIEFVKTTAATATLTASTLKENRSDMEVYPNPAQGGKSVFVDLNRFGNKETIMILIYDETGHLIQSLPIKTDTTGKALVELPVLSGFYIIRAESKTKVLSRKLIVN